MSDSIRAMVGNLADDDLLDLLEVVSDEVKKRNNTSVDSVTDAVKIAGGLTQLLLELNKSKSGG